MSSDHPHLRDVAPDPLVGKLLEDKYEVERKIGQGGMGAVYEAKHSLTGRRVAIKVLHALLAAEPQIVERFKREARAATAIGNPHIVEVLDMGRLREGGLFLVLEFLEGSDLDGVLKKDGPLPTRRAVHILSQVCDALGAAHDKGIVHRDLKPENVFLIERADDRDFVKLLDFGVAKIVEGASKGMTGTGTALGTPYYMSPEQAQGRRELDHRADIYSLGVMSYEALAGRLPFEDESYPLLLFKICMEAPTALAAIRPDLPPGLTALIDRMMSKNPDERFQSTREVKAALAAFKDIPDAVPIVSLSGLPRATPPAPTPHTPTPPQARTQALKPAESTAPERKRRPLLWIGAGLAIFGGLFGLGAIALSLGGESNDPDVTEEVAPELSEPARVAVHIEASPRAAELFLDGDPIANPFSGEIALLSEPRTIEARLEGYVSETRRVMLHVPQRVTLELSPTSTGEPVVVAPPEEPTMQEPVVEEERPTMRDRPTMRVSETVAETVMEEFMQVVLVPPPPDPPMDEATTMQPLKRVMF